ncbi:MAG: phosphoadenosine phosphosulfate reductase family protein [Methanoregulaceae archaeon]|nr:phosphoadenosine phosphosulfate reductase family protein [Methanoregulaceae archaeon]
MRPSYLGKILLHWCDSCHTPVLSPHCSCGSEARAVPVTPPGDARPAFQADIDLVNRIFEDHFGSPLVPPGHLVLLNKVPETDRMEEIVIGGAVVGSIRYLPKPGLWEPIPRPEAAACMKPKKRYVMVEAGAEESIHEKGASVLAPGLLFIDPSVRKGDEIFILSSHGECIGVGRAKVDAEAARSMERGAIVRTRRNVRSECRPGEASWDDAVRANEHVITRAEEESVRFVKNVSGKHNLPVTVSYSGGKDSLATLLVVLKSLGKVPLLFADTGFELPETYQNVCDVAETFGLDCVRADGNQNFWEVFEKQGPPAVNFRWCCRVAKLGPVGETIGGTWGECLSFIGQRKYESLRRKNSPRVWRNNHIPNQLSAAPIQNWTALHVWLYIFRENAPYNPLYERGLDRIGCFMCPSSDIAVLRLIQDRYPDLWENWRVQLKEWQERHDLPDEWLHGERWRMKEACVDEDDSYY